MILPEIIKNDTGSKVFLDYDRINLPIRVKGREEGDRFYPLGANGSKKLKDFLSIKRYL